MSHLLGQKAIDCLRLAETMSDYDVWHANYAVLCERYSAKAVDRKMEELADRGYVEYGVSARMAWLTAKGRFALWFETIRVAREALPPPPGFDRVAVRHKDELASIPMTPDVGRLTGTLAAPLLGFPVVTDPGVPAGVIELRHGDRVVGRVQL